MPDLTWTLVSFLLTLMILSYIFGDNPLFRLASYIFVGVSAGYAAVLVFYQVLIPRLIMPLMQGAATERLLAIVPLVGAVLILLKLSPRLSRLGNIPMAFVVGAGAAVLIGGAVIGTLVGQLQAAVGLFNPDLQTGYSGFYNLIAAVVMLVGTVSALLYFQFGPVFKANSPLAQRGPLVDGAARLGQAFIAITLGALFAGVFATALVAMIDRLDFIIKTIFMFF
jgi:hypothetical protein